MGGWRTGGDDGLVQGAVVWMVSIGEDEERVAVHTPNTEGDKARHGAREGIACNQADKAATRFTCK